VKRQLHQHVQRVADSSSATFACLPVGCNVGSCKNVPVLLSGGSKLSVILERKSLFELSKTPTHVVGIGTPSLPGGTEKG
jgi:hypothetical protein